MGQIFLLSSIGGDLSQSVARCIKEQYRDSFLLGTDTHTEHSGSLFVDKFLLAKPASSRGFIDSLTETLQSVKPDFYFPLSEAELSKLSSLNVSKLESMLGSTKIVWSGSEVIKTFLNKTKTMDFLSAIKLDVPKSYALNEEETLVFPVVVKPNNGSGSKNVFVCSNSRELEASLVFVSNPIIQEYIPGPESEFTVGMFAINGQRVKNMTFRRRLSSGGGTSWCERVFDPEIDDICKKIAYAVGLNGSLNVQLRKSNGKYFIFEINPRFSSTVHIRSQLGFKDVIWSLYEEYDDPDFSQKISLASKFGVFSSNALLE